MKENLPKDARVHMHCHSGSKQFSTDLAAHFPNLFFGFTGAITFGNGGATEQHANIRDGVIPLTRILLETDAPYMNPAARGRTAHPGHIPWVAHKIAQLCNVSIDEVYRATRANTTRMYGI
eukprot:TRINITY_DN10918_c0_g1_i2.p3 TRINITY_DN10918_c0_g1~~TRINITY_DN10918_c0_g1_i2.p3  ORF type:complete len:121 (+),score=18.52 TRINITY_DN10918_c0_g1_i2:619-981(+)